MNKSFKPKSKWWLWGNIALLFPAAYTILTLGFGHVPLLLRQTGEATRGRVPDVSFVPSMHMWLLLAAMIVFLVLFFQILRYWAQYFLSRKMLLSYLFFAIIPVVTTVLIFVSISRVMLGISSLLTFEDAVDRYASSTERYARSLRRAAFRHESSGEKIEYMVEALQSELPDPDTEARIFWVTDKVPGTKRYIIPIHPRSEERQDVMAEGSIAYAQYWPEWLTDNEWHGMVNLGGRLCMRQFLQSGNYLVIVTTPIEGRFLRNLPGFQVLAVTMLDLAGTNYISTSDLEASWYQKLPILSPFTTEWDCGAFDWQSGFFQQYGSISFGLELATLGAVLENTSGVDFFYSGQKLSSVKLIVGIILVVMFCVLIALVFGGYLVSYITRSLNLLALGHEQIANGQLLFRLPFIGKDQLGAMGTSFNNMASSIDSLMVEVTEKEKYHEELRIARDIQMSLLPNIKALPWATNISAVCIPAKDVGGDYYELVKTPSDEIGIFIADVSGKGTSAAFYMAELKGVLIALRHLWSFPHELMLALNDIMRTTLKSNVFISAAYLLLDPKAKTGELARAGHCPTFHVKANGDVDELSPPGMAIGIAPNQVFGKILKTCTFEMSDEDKVLLYTDGLDEMAKDNELYGLPRLRQILKRNTHLDVDHLKQAVLDDVFSFLEAGAQSDDLTMVVAGLPEPDLTTDQKTPADQTEVLA